MEQREATLDRLRRISHDLRRIVKSLEKAAVQRRRMESEARTAEARRRRSG